MRLMTLSMVSRASASLSLLVKTGDTGKTSSSVPNPNEVASQRLQNDSLKHLSKEVPRSWGFVRANHTEMALSCRSSWLGSTCVISARVEGRGSLKRRPLVGCCIAGRWCTGGPTCAPPRVQHSRIMISIWLSKRRSIPDMESSEGIS